MICPPEFNVYKPNQCNDFNYVVEIIDPPSQGVYKSFKLDAGVSKDTLRINIEYAMMKIYNEIGLVY